ncbi:hypothetical protein SDC9_132587 [bioreactor metagenome]|uniref:Uncharacterized protein n=1 Tax=bioreactor metagenome TaxID=1076179 RepID=A0A645D811_9ZZZZ
MEVEHLFREREEFHRRVEVFGVLTEHDDVDVGVLRERSADSGELLRGTDIDVEVKELTHLKDGGLEALHAGLGGDGRHKRGVRVADRFDRFGRNGVAARVALAEFLV